MKTNETIRTKSTHISLYTRAKYSFVRGGLLLIVKLTGLDGLYRFGQIFGYIEFILRYKKRSKAYVRFEEIFGQPLTPAKKRLIVRRHVCRTRCDKMIYTIMDRIDRKMLLDRLEIKNRQYLDDSIKLGSGTFLMFSHFGSHHLGGILLTLEGYPVIGLRDPNESPLRLYIQQQFEKSFPELKDFQITASDSFARTFFHAFKKNSIVAAAMDVWRDRGNVRMEKVTVFGQEREFLSGMTHIALKSHAPIFVGFLLSLPNYHYRIDFHPWLNDPKTEGDAASIMQQYANLIESYAKKYPCHVSKTQR